MSIDLTKVIAKYRGQWVAFKEDQKTVIGNGKTAKEAYEKALAKGYENPVLTRLPRELVNYIG
jgi:hypothetical protein